MNWEYISRTITLIAVIIAALSAYFSFRSSAATMRSADAVMFNEFHDSYSSYDMADALRQLRELRASDEEQYGVD